MSRKMYHRKNISLNQKQKQLLANVTLCSDSCRNVVELFCHEVCFKKRCRLHICFSEIHMKTCKPYFYSKAINFRDVFRALPNIYDGPKRNISLNRPLYLEFIIFFMFHRQHLGTTMNIRGFSPLCVISQPFSNSNILSCCYSYSYHC